MIIYNRSGPVRSWDKLTSEVVPRVDPELPAIIGVVLDPLGNRRRISAVALQPPVDGADGGAEALAGGEEGVAVVHPKPESGLEGDDGVGGDGVGVVEAVEADALPGGAVVEVPGELDGAAAVVELAGGAGVLGVAAVAVVRRCAVDLVDVAQVSGFMSNVGEEGCNFPLRVVGGPRSSELGVRRRSFKEGGSGVEPLPLATRSSLVRYPVKEGIGDHATHSPTARRSGGGRVARPSPAPYAAVGVAGAAVAPLAAAESLRTPTVLG